MRRRRPKGCRALRGDDGMTLIELAIVVSLLIVVLGMILTVLDDTQANFARQISRSTSNDQLRLAVESIDRDVRSGDVLYDPAAETFNPGCSTAQFPTCGDISPGMSLRVYTESNSPTRGGTTCVQWRITGRGDLQRRSWAAGISPVSSGWRIVATNVSNRADGVAAFSRSSSTQAALINVDLRANEDPSHAKGSTVQVTESVTGRNTVQVTNPQQPCGPATPDPSISTTPPNYPIPSY